jgi:hypothetical protein
MEALSEAVKSDRVGREVKKERSLSSKHELYTICAEKIGDYIKEKSLRGENFNSSPSKKGRLIVPNVLSAVFDGLRGVYLDLQETFIHMVGQCELIRIELNKNKEETH